MVESLIGNFGEPLSRLAVHIVQVGELAQWPEILTHVPNAAAFHFFLWRKSSTTPDGDGARQHFRVTHPFHPLFGQEFEHVSYRHNWGEDRVYYFDSEGRVRAIPACWTSVAAVDVFVAISAGRSLFRYEDLAKLADLLERIQG